MRVVGLSRLAEGAALVQDRPLEQLTVREMFTEADRLARELSDHLDKGFVPRVATLSKLVKPGQEDPDAPPVEDGVVRTHAAQVLESDQFTEKLYTRLHEFCQAIDQKMGHIITGG